MHDDLPTLSVDFQSMRPSPSAPPECGAPDKGTVSGISIASISNPIDPTDPLEKHELFEALAEGYADGKYVDTEAMRMQAGYAQGSLGRERRLGDEKFARTDEDGTRRLRNE